jgi:hypothetical protein
MATCEGRVRGGGRCRAKALDGSAFCYFHDPARSRSRAAGRRKGGQVRARKAAVLPEGTPPPPLASVPDVVSLLGETVHQVRTGAVDVKVSNAVALLAGQLLRALLPSNFTQALDSLAPDVEALKRERDNALAAGGAPPRAEAPPETGGRPPGAAAGTGQAAG